MQRTTIDLAILIAALCTAAGLAVAQADRATGAEPVPRPAPQQQQRQPPQRQQDTQAAGVLLFVPQAFITADPNFGKGCWVSLYDRTNFSGDQVTIVGPATIPDLDLVMRGGDPDSLVVGPRAQVTAYDHDNFRDHSANLLAGQRLADLQDGQFGVFQGIESLRVTCTS